MAIKTVTTVVDGVESEYTIGQKVIRADAKKITELHTHLTRMNWYGILSLLAIFPALGLYVLIAVKFESFGFDRFYFMCVFCAILASVHIYLATSIRRDVIERYTSIGVKPFSAYPADYAPAPYWAGLLLPKE